MFFFLCLAILVQLINGFPLPGADWIVAKTDCTPDDTYNITSQVSFVTDPQLIAGVTCNGGYSGCQLGVTQGYAVTVTKRFGFQLALSKIIGIGLAVDVSISTTNAEAITAYAACPSSYQCGLQVRATMYNVTGWKKTECKDGARTCPCSKPLFEQYEVHFPVLVPGSQKNAEAVVEYSPCIVQYSPNSFSRPPSIPLCPLLPSQAGYNNETGGVNLATQQSQQQSDLGRPRPEGTS